MGYSRAAGVGGEMERFEEGGGGKEMYIIMQQWRSGGCEALERSGGSRS